MKDINGKIIKEGQTIKWLKNTTDLRQYDNYTAKVCYEKEIGLYTDSPFKGAFRPLNPDNAKQVEVIND